MELDIVKIVDTIKDVGISGTAAFGGMTGLETTTIHPEPTVDLAVKSIIAIIAGVLTRLLTLLFKRRKDRRKRR